MSPLDTATGPELTRRQGGITTSAWVLLTRRAFLDARIRTIVFVYVFALYAYIQPRGYRSAYPTASQRQAFADSFETNRGLRLLFGLPHHLASVSGYTAWRVGGVLAIAAAGYGLVAAVRATRAEEDSGRLETVLAGPVSKRTVGTAALAAIGIGIALLWVAEFAGLVLGGLPAGGAAYLALATVSVIPVCAGIGVLAAQLAPDHRTASLLGGVLIAVLFLLRVLADSLNGLGWLRWVTPLGWAEQLRPFAGAQPVVLLAPALATLLLLALAARLAATRDIGTGVLSSHDTADARTRLLHSTTAQAVREQQGVLIAWAMSVGVFLFILGTVAKSISPADISKSLDKDLAKLGSGAITSPTGYLAFIFIFVAVAVCAFVCGQVGAAGQEEAEGRLETLLALPVGRRRWLAGRLGLAAVAATALALTAGLLAWAGASTGSAHVSLPHLLEAGANTLPVTILFLGIATLAYATVPRIGQVISYGLLAVAFLWQIVGSLLAAPQWLLDVTPFAHVAAVPTEPFRAVAAIVMVVIGAALMLAALVWFDERDLAHD